MMLLVAAASLFPAEAYSQQVGLRQGSRQWHPRNSSGLGLTIGRAPGEAETFPGGAQRVGFYNHLALPRDLCRGPLHDHRRKPDSVPLQALRRRGRPDVHGSGLGQVSADLQRRARLCQPDSTGDGRGKFHSTIAFGLWERAWISTRKDAGGRAWNTHTKASLIFIVASPTSTTL